MSFYLEILSVQSPIDIGNDENRRKMFSVNFEAMAVAPVTDFEREIGKLINNAGLGTLGTDMFIGMDLIYPAGDGPYVGLINHGGSAPEDIHNDAAGHTYEMLAIQVVVRARSHDASKTRALAIWRSLDGVRNTTVVA